MAAMNDSSTSGAQIQAVGSLREVEDCLNEVHSRLDQQAESKYVTRFSEKNMLTHRCMNAFDRWRRAHQAWTKETCHASKDADACRQLQLLFDEKEITIRKSLVATFEAAEAAEARAFAGLIGRVELGTKLIAPSCPFKPS